MTRYVRLSDGRLVTINFFCHLRSFYFILSILIFSHFEDSFFHSETETDQVLVRFPWRESESKSKSKREGESSIDFVACDVLRCDTKSIILLPHEAMKQLF